MKKLMLTIAIFIVLAVMFGFTDVNAQNIKNSSIKDFKRDHPERLKDEVYLTNCNPFSYYKIEYTKDGLESFVYIDSDKEILMPVGYVNEYSSIGWKTKRLGNISYDIYGKRINGYRPVFVKIEEIRNTKNGKERLNHLLP